MGREVQSSFLDLPDFVFSNICQLLVEHSSGYVNNYSFRDLLSLRTTCSRLNRMVLMNPTKFRLGLLLGLNARPKELFFDNNNQSSSLIHKNLFEFISHKTNWNCDFLRVTRFCGFAKQRLPINFEKFLLGNVAMFRNSLRVILMSKFERHAYLLELLNLFLDNCMMSSKLQLILEFEVCANSANVDYGFIGQLVPSSLKYCVSRLKIEHSDWSTDIDMRDEDLTMLSRHFPNIANLSLHTVRSLNPFTHFRFMRKLELYQLPTFEHTYNVRLNAVSSLLIKDQPDVCNALDVIVKCFPNLKSLDFVPSPEWREHVLNGFNF